MTSVLLLLINYAAAAVTASQCATGHFPCRQEDERVTCLAEERACDGIVDCDFGADKSDESDCDHAQCASAPFWWVPLATQPTLCAAPGDFDGGDECVDDSGCFEGNCKRLSNYDESETDQCFCPEGYRECGIARNLGYHDCVAIDVKCEGKVCDHACQNGECICAEGYAAAAGGGACVKPGELSFVTVDHRGMLAINDDQIELGATTGIDTGFVSASRSCFYRARNGDVVCVDKKGQKEIFVNLAIGANMVVDMAFDEISQNYYYVLVPSKQVWLCSGQFGEVQRTCRVMLSDITEYMGPLNIDAEHALLFFIEKNDNQRRATHLYSVKLDGSVKRRLLALTPAKSYDGPISDPRANRVYWIEYTSEAQASGTLYGAFFSASTVANDEKDETAQIRIRSVPYNGDGQYGAECTISYSGNGTLDKLAYRMVNGRHLVTGPDWGEVLEVDFVTCQIVDQRPLPHFSFFGVHGKVDDDLVNPCDADLACDEVCITDYREEVLTRQCQCQFGHYRRDDTCTPYGDDEFALFVDDGIEIYSKKTEDQSYTKWDQHFSLGRVKPDFFAWIEPSGEVKVILSTIGRNDQNVLTLRKLSTLAVPVPVTHGVNEIAHIAVDPLKSNVYWSQNDKIHISTFAENRAPGGDLANYAVLTHQTKLGHRINALHYDQTSQRLLIFESIGRTGSVDITVFDSAPLATKRINYENFNPASERFIDDIVACEDTLNLFFISSTDDSGYFTDMKQYSFTISNDQFDDFVVGETVKLPDGFAFSTGHRDIGCHPLHGLVAIVCPIEHYARQFKLIDLSSMELVDEFDISFRPYGVQFPTKVVPQTSPDICPGAHIQLEKTCLCNEGYVLDGDLKCHKSGTYDKIQNYCYASQFKCHSGECIQSAYQCDGEGDCRDHSDELACSIDCTANQFQCLKSGQCIALEQVCDGQSQCADQSDEADCINCPSGFLPCVHVAPGKRTLCYPEESSADACELALDGKPYDLVLSTSQRVNLFFGDEMATLALNDHGSIVHATLNYVLGSPLFLTLDRNLSDTTHTLVTISTGPFRRQLDTHEWSAPYFTPKLIIPGKTQMAKFRYGKVYQQTFIMTSEPDAIWSEDVYDTAQSAQLLYMSREGERLVDFELLDCFNTLFVLSQTNDDIMVVKLPGYDYASESGYKYTFDSPTGKAVDLAVSEKTVCIALVNEQKLEVHCQTHDVNAAAKVAATFDSVEYVKMAFDADGESLFVIYGSELEKMRMTKLTVNKATLENADFNAKLVSEELKFDASFDSGDFVAFPRHTCQHDLCAVTRGLDDEVALIPPDLGRCESECRVEGENTATAVVRCDCAAGGELRADHRTCVSSEAADYCNSLFIGSKTCYSGHFWACSVSKDLVPIDQVCDGAVDCPAREDEEHCAMWTGSNGAQHRPTTTPCPIGHFKCRSGQCVAETSVTWVDQESDKKRLGSDRGCVDASDVFYADKSPLKLFCHHNPDSARCLQPMGLVVDDDNVNANNNNNEEEEGDETRPTPLFEEVCSTSEFKCSNGDCIPTFARCDGVPDCPDDSDEYDCPSCRPDLAYACSAEERTTCVRTEFLCDHHRDCPNGFDEEPEVCGYDEKTEMCTKGTDHWNPANERCEPVDESKCSVEFFPCSQICSITSNKKPLCSCADDYRPSDAQYGCVQASDELPLFIFNNQKTVKGFTLNKEQLSTKLEKPVKTQTLSKDHSNTVGLDYNYHADMYYWSAVSSSAARREAHVNKVKVDKIGLMTSYPEDLFKNDQADGFIMPDHEQIDSLAVDWVTGRLYVADKKRATIRVMNDDGSFVKTIAHNQTDSDHARMIQHPRALTFYQLHGTLYFSDWGDQAHIGRIGMDGSNVEILLDKSKQLHDIDIGWPNDIVIDRAASDSPFSGHWSPKPNIYWCDAKFDHIARADADFTNVHIIYKVPEVKEEHIFSMALFGDYIYFADWKNQRSIMRIHKFCTVDCQPETVTQQSADKPMAMAIVHSLMQPPLPQAASNGHEAPTCDDLGCEQLCLLAPSNYSDKSFAFVCACGDNYELKADGKTCEPASCQHQNTHLCSTDGLCVYEWQIGDGTKDCVDDEEDAFVKEHNLCQWNHSHNYGHFTCANTTEAVLDGKLTLPGDYCVTRDQVCNGQRDCADGSDEFDCQNYPCPENRHRRECGYVDLEIEKTRNMCRCLLIYRAGLWSPFLRLGSIHLYVEYVEMHF